MDVYHHLTGLFRRFRTFVLRREVEIVGRCRMCGSCCQDIMLRHDGKWIRSEKQFRELCEYDPRHARFQVTCRDVDGYFGFTCSLLKEEGSCTSYADRLPLCRNYPAKTLYYQGSWLRADCGFSFKSYTFRDFFFGRSKRPVPQFSEILRREVEQDKEQSS